jgi:Protein of unknown function (DUF998)/alpha/beta hydrolase fold
MPAVPGATDAFVVAAVDPPRDLVLTVPDGHDGHAVAWEHALEPIDPMQPRISHKALLACGVLASLTYVASDIFASLRYAGYSFTDQAVSELFAIGAPTIRIVVPLFTLSSTLLAAFAFGVWTSCGHSRALRWLAIMIFANALNTLVLWNFFPMHMRGVPPTFTDAMHIVLAINPFVLLSVVFGMAAFKGWFRSYSAATALVLLVPAIFSLSYVSAVAANQPTPGMGLAERVSQYGYQLWQAMLAVVLLREGRQMMFQASAFKTAEGEAKFLAAYDNAMKLWPVPYEQIDVRNRFGTTHVVICGPKTAPPLVLLHGYMATLAMWSPNIAAFSKEYRVYAVDVMGQPSKSSPSEPICNVADFVSWLTATLNALHLDRVSCGHVVWWLAGSQLRGRRLAACCETRPAVTRRAAADGQTVHHARNAHGLAPDTLYREHVLSLARIHGSGVRESARYGLSRP